MRKLEDRPTTVETLLSPQTEDPGREKNRLNNSDLLRWQTNRPSPATDSKGPEKRQREESIRSPEVDEDETESPLAHCGNPE